MTKSELRIENEKLNVELEKFKKKYANVCTMFERWKGHVKKLQRECRIAKAQKNGMVKPEDYTSLARYTKKLELDFVKLKKKKENCSMK